MVVRAKFQNGVQTFEELCEHCGEKISDLDISEITTKHPKDPRVIRITGSKGNIALKTRQEKIIEMSSSYIAKGLLDVDEAKDAYDAKKFKYGVRPEAMCSESIDTVSETTQSYCYRVTSTKFLTKVIGGKTLSASFYDPTEVDSDITGSKVGIDRKGNIIRTRSEKKLTEPNSALKYKGPDQTNWWRALNEAQRKSWIAQAQACQRLISQYGEKPVKTMQVVENFRDAVEWDTYMRTNCR